MNAKQPEDLDTFGRREPRGRNGWRNMACSRYDAPGFLIDTNAQTGDNVTRYPSHLSIFDADERDLTLDSSVIYQIRAAASALRRQCQESVQHCKAKEV